MVSVVVGGQRVQLPRKNYDFASGWPQAWLWPPRNLQLEKNVPVKACELLGWKLGEDRYVGTTADFLYKRETRRGPRYYHLTLWGRPWDKTVTVITDPHKAVLVYSQMEYTYGSVQEHFPGVQVVEE